MAHAPFLSATDPTNIPAARPARANSNSGGPGLQADLDNGTTQPFQIPQCKPPLRCIGDTPNNTNQNPNRLKELGKEALKELGRELLENQGPDNCADTEPGGEGLYGNCRQATTDEHCTQTGNPHTDRYDLGDTRICQHGTDSLADTHADTHTTRPPDTTSCEPNSFDPDTPVLLADGTTKKISDIHVGDQVFATNPDTGQTEPRTVTHLITGTGTGTGTGTKHLVDITITTPTGPATLTATNHHPFWNPDTHHWENADQLTTGDHLQTPTGQPTTITTTHTYQRVDTVYNLTIADLHTYYVLAGNTPILVHNSNCNIIASGIDNSAALSSHGVGDVFSGVYDPVDGRLVLRLSVDDDVTPRAPGSVMRFGGHGQILLEDFAGSRSAIGFTVHFEQDGFSVGWKSRSVNRRNFGDPMAPPGSRTEILEAIEATMGRRTWSR
ncbi:hypothetical protein ACG83_17630 [Frankia sp. R43]|uniref:polymorphic toxin-type HINT domain-containing protein n=1 Tax=Frankia sp. R43 TaxID=269536 RepID=UPI0006C9F900|nr:polymorphic toxin-type HINT domain-containing protein [Frankia sp. R43]KPM55134.1 hypothetical protein ACG83_17630 [Frankia sp. R43]